MNEDEDTFLEDWEHDTRWMTAVIFVFVALIFLWAMCDVQAATRSRTQRDAFVRTHACPATHSTKRAPCPGYIVDHIKPLCKGGPDKASNMQWQTIAAAKAKDKWECKR